MANRTRAQRVLDVIIRPPTSPLRQLTLYYILLVAVGSLLATQVPFIGDTIAGLAIAGPDEEASLRDLLAMPVATPESTITFALRMATVMLATLLINIPFSWGYMSIRARSGFEQSVVQTLVVLPIVVAGIMMIVKFSLALAFALGGVAAAVRFRNTLKDVADATYVFLAIGIGIAAGTGALPASLVMSAVFTYASVLLWSCNFGWCDVPAEEKAGKEPSAAGEARSARTRHELTLETTGAGQQSAIEDFLTVLTKRWRLRRSSPTLAGATRLVYDVRLKRSVKAGVLSAGLREYSVIEPTIADHHSRKRHDT